MTRIDVWLWSVRVYKSRSLATAAVKGGHIRLNGDPVKPSHAVKPGDTVIVDGFQRISVGGKVVPHPADQLQRSMHDPASKPVEETTKAAKAKG